MLCDKHRAKNHRWASGSEREKTQGKQRVQAAARGLVLSFQAYQIKGCNGEAKISCTVEVQRGVMEKWLASALASGGRGDLLFVECFLHVCFLSWRAAQSWNSESCDQRHSGRHNTQFSSCTAWCGNTWYLCCCGEADFHGSQMLESTISTEFRCVPCVAHVIRPRGPGLRCQRISCCVSLLQLLWASAVAWQEWFQPTRSSG